MCLCSQLRLGWHLKSLRPGKTLSYWMGLVANCTCSPSSVFFSGKKKIKLPTWSKRTNLNTFLTLFSMLPWHLKSSKCKLSVWTMGGDNCNPIQVFVLHLHNHSVTLFKARFKKKMRFDTDTLVQLIAIIKAAIRFASTPLYFFQICFYWIHLVHRALNAPEILWTWSYLLWLFFQHLDKLLPTTRFILNIPFFLFPSVPNMN